MACFQILNAEHIPLIKVKFPTSQPNQYENKTTAHIHPIFIYDCPTCTVSANQRPLWGKY